MKVAVAEALKDNKANAVVVGDVPQSLNLSKLAKAQDQKFQGFAAKDDDAVGVAKKLNKKIQENAPTFNTDGDLLKEVLLRVVELGFDIAFPAAAEDCEALIKDFKGVKPKNYKLKSIEDIGKDVLHLLGL